MANKKVSQLVAKPSVLVTDLFPIADPTTGQLYKTTISDLGTAIGSGVSSVNTLVGAVVLDTDDIQELASPTNRWFTDTRARAAVSASSPLAYNSGTGVFSIPQATGSQNGFLSSADWTTFNAKQQALSGTGFVKISGTTISYDNSTYLTTSAAASTYLALAGGTLTGALNGTSATFTGDLTISSANPRLYFTDTNNNPDYFISNTDGTFTVYDVTNSTSRFTIGTTGNATFTNAITGGGSITGESIYSNGIVSVGTGLTVGTTISATGSITGASIIRSGGTSSQFLKADGSVDSTAYLPLGGGTMTGVLFGASASFSGFVGFGGNTSPLAAIDVTGAGRFSSTISAAGATLTGALSGTTLALSGGTGGINFTSSTTITNTASSGFTAIYANGGGVYLGGSASVNHLSIASGGAATFSNFVRVEGQYLQVANASAPSVYINNTTVQWRAYLPSSSNNFAISDAVRDVLTLGYNGGNSYFQGCNVGIGTTAPSQRLDVAGNIVNSGYIYTNGNLATANGNQSANSVSASLFLGNRGFFSSPDIGAAQISAISTGTFWYSGTAMAFYTNPGPDVTGTGNVERMRITSGGDLCIASTAPVSTRRELRIGGNASGSRISMGLNGTNYSALVTDSGGNVYLANEFNDSAIKLLMINYNNGVYLSQSATSWTSNSDERLKTDLVPIENATEKVSSLRSVIGRYKTDDESKRRPFLIAQDVYQVLPEAVDIDKKTGMMGVQYTEVIPLLVASIKELKAKIETLENK